MVGEYLGKAGFHVIHAESGTRGLALHGREPLDVVILDLMLPDTDGLDVCRQIRARRPHGPRGRPRNGGRRLFAEAIRAARAVGAAARDPAPRPSRAQTGPAALRTARDRPRRSRSAA